MQHCLQALGFRFTDNQVIVDLSTYNAGRIWKVYGTLAAKGDDAVDRPHRHATLLEFPSRVEVVSPTLLAQLVATLPHAPTEHGKRSGLDLDAWLSKHKIPVVSAAPWNGGRKWILNPCPWNPEHTNRAAYVVQLSNGAVAAGCHHASCAGKDWAALRALFESDPQTASCGARTQQETVHGQAREQQRLSQVRRLLLLGAEAELFHTPDTEL